MLAFGSSTRLARAALWHEMRERWPKNASSGARGSIEICTFVRGDRVLVEISDDGFIPEAIQSRIFEPFTGQGLAICRSIVADKHSGAIYFRTTPGAGTTFTVELPLEHAAKVSPSPSSPEG